MERSSTIFAVSSHFNGQSTTQSRRSLSSGCRDASSIAQGRGSEGARGEDSTRGSWNRSSQALAKEISETRQWAYEQQAYFGLLPKHGARRTHTADKRPRDARHGPTGLNFDGETARSRGGRRRTADELYAEQSQLQEEFDMMEAKWQERIGREERRRRQAQQWAEEQKQMERRSQEEAWKAYERRWATITIAGDHGGSSPLRFKSIPWPMTVPPKSVADITPVGIAKFIFSPAHSEGMGRKERIKCALRRWHPDRFGRVLGRVDGKDKEAVERGVGIVARCLNDLLAQEKN
ncbi:hypothetical protein F5888DRAFT_904334 [Russula emetica]|nr:hypothetical protein F5888DRAFT_904334 [Russula emetica]